MRVLQVVHQFLPKYVGGVEVYVAGLSRGLRDRGHQVALFTGGDEAGESRWEDMPVHTVVGGLRGPRGVVSTFLTTFANRQAEARFRDLCLVMRPDVVHFHHLLGLSPRLIAIAARMGIGTVFTLHDYWFMCSNTRLLQEEGGLCGGPALGVNCASCAATRLGIPALKLLTPAVAPVFMLRGRVVQRALRQADVLVAPSHFLHTLALQHGLPQERLVCMGLGLDTQELNIPSDGATRPASGPVRLVYVGAISEQKGVHLLVDAFGRLEIGLAQLSIYGDGSASPEYARRLRENGAQDGVHFLGPVARGELGGVLAEADAVVVPSIWYENAPLVVQEAFAAGVPVIASRVGALAEQVRDGVDGILFQVGDPQDLAEKLQLFAQDVLLRTRLRENLPKVKSLPQHLEEVEQLYRKVVAAKNQEARRWSP